MGTEKRRVRITPDTLHRELSGEGVLLQLETGQYFGLNSVAQRMWELMIEHGDLELVRNTLCAEFDADPEVLSADLDRFTAQLVEKKLVEIETTPDQP